MGQNYPQQSTLFPHSSILHYLTLLTCPHTFRAQCSPAGQPHAHYTRSIYSCGKCAEGGLCKYCSQYSVYLKYVYKSDECRDVYCLRHYFTSVHNAIFYFNGSVLILFDSKTKAKTELHLSMSVIEDSDSISYGSRIFSMGGVGPTDKVFEVDFLSKTLLSRSHMLCKKYAHTLCILDAFIYSIGGYQPTESLADCEKYDIKEDKWAKLPKLNMPREWCAAFVWCRNAYAFCGFNDGRELSSLERLKLEPVSWSWHNIALKNQLHGRKWVHAVPMNDGVAIIGGYGTNTAVAHGQAHITASNWCSLRTRQSAI